MVLFVLSFNSLQIRACNVELSSIVRQRAFRGIKVDPITDLLSEVYKRQSLPKRKKLTRKHEYI